MNSKINSKSVQLFLTHSGDKEIQSFIIEFYQDASNFESTNISIAYSKLFVMINKLSKLEIFNVYFSFLILDNKEFIKLFTSNTQAILSLTEISILLEDCSKQHKDSFKNIAIIIFKSNCDKISFYDLCNTLFVLQKNNSFLYSNYIEIVDKKLLTQKALEESLVPLSKGLLILSKIIDHSLSKEIYTKIDKTILNINTQKDNIEASLKALNILKGIHYTKTYDNFTLKKIEIDFQTKNLTEITDIMLEIIEFSTSHEMKDFFSTKLTFELLTDKIKDEELPIIANQLTRLYKCCFAIKDIILKVFQSITTDVFLIKARYLTISEIEIIINQLSRFFGKINGLPKKIL